jgi:hypothetical protein
MRLEAALPTAVRTASSSTSRMVSQTKVEKVA